MIVNLDVPFIDSQVEDLSFVPRAQSLPVLASLESSWRIGRLSLRLLGASHQAVMTFPDGSHYAETVACLPGSTPGVPARFDTRVGDWRFDFSSQVESVSTTWLSEHCEQLRRNSDADNVLLGAFPGEDDALTYLSVSSRLGEWRTVHCYPESKCVVRTRTTLTPIAGTELAAPSGGKDEK